MCLELWRIFYVNASDKEMTWNLSLLCYIQTTRKVTSVKYYTAFGLLAFWFLAILFPHASTCTSCGVRHGTPI